MKKLLLLITMSAAGLLITQAAHAAGIGVYGTAGANMSTWVHKDRSDSTTDYFYGCGLAVDSSVAKDDSFGYRFTAGYSQYRMKDPDTEKTSDPLHRVSMSHTFGFAMLRNQTLRLWVGPRLGMNYLHMRKTYTEYGFMYYPRKITFELDMLGFDALLAFGINVNAGDLATVFFDFGFGYMGNYNISIKENGHGFGFEGKIGFMFRINDSYKQSSPGGDIKIQVQDQKQ